ncbi:MAG: hypothetical protein AB7V61_06895 [Methylocystis sp.]|uniref:hypothetical protein n=1 Tax=Methylocystis sp. TaxID=1911079 RepID=UPI003D0E79DD
MVAWLEIFQQDFERVADAAQLAAVAADFFENFLLYLRARGLPEIDIDDPKRRALLKKGQRIDRLEKSLRRQ